MKSITDIINEGNLDMKLWNAVDKIKDELGAEKFLNELCQGMSDDTLKDLLKFIAKNYEINIKL